MTNHTTTTPVLKRRSIRLIAAALAATTIGITGAQIVSGANNAQETVFVPITPCRLMDTRAAQDINTGPRNTPISQDETALFNAHDGSDANSDCTIPTTATAIATNTVAINPTARGYLTLYPGNSPTPEPPTSTTPPD